jgi:2-dehydropantoate 2-reductase
MKIAFIGTGALGGYYAARLAHAGGEVHCLLRADYDVVAREGLRVKSCEGDFSVKVQAHRKPETIGIADLVVVCVKTTSNESVPPLLKPVVGPDTIVLTLQNGLGNEEFLSRFVSDSQIMGGVCFLCSNRIAPGHIHHIAHGHIHVAEFKGGARERTRRIAKMFTHARVKCEAMESLGEVRWRKLVWNIPFNGLSITANGATVEEILQDPELLATTRVLMSETIRTANKEGHKIPDEFIDQNILYSSNMGRYKTSMQLDFEAGRPLEVEAIVGEPVRRAAKAGVHVPAIQELYATIRRWSAQG